jgi:hypothetical protein
MLRTLRGVPPAAGFVDSILCLFQTCRSRLPEAFDRLDRLTAFNGFSHIRWQTVQFVEGFRHSSAERRASGQSATVDSSGDQQRRVSRKRRRPRRQRELRRSCPRLKHLSLPRCHHFRTRHALNRYPTFTTAYARIMDWSRSQGSVLVGQTRPSGCTTKRFKLQKIIVDTFLQQSRIPLAVQAQMPFVSRQNCASAARMEIRQLRRLCLWKSPFRAS